MPEIINDVNWFNECAGHPSRRYFQALPVPHSYNSILLCCKTVDKFECRVQILCTQASLCLLVRHRLRLQKPTDLAIGYL